MLSINQKTISDKITCKGVGLHSGKDASITLISAPANTGIIFKRVDLKEGENVIKANFRNVVGTNLGTSLTNEFGAKVSTIEHLMAAIWGCGIDNLVIEIDGPEIPIMDGSSAPFIFLIECCGITIQEEQRQVIEILKTVRIEDGDKFVEVSPSKEFGLDLEIDFNHPQIPRQSYKFSNSNQSFKNDISKARTFGFKKEIDHLRSIGLALGGSLDNAILVDDNGLVNSGGLRYENEFVRHKTLDFIGDIFLAGHYIIGNFKAFKSGHGINNKLLHELFNNPDSYRLV